MDGSKVISLWSKAGHQNGITTTTIAVAVNISKLFPDKSILIIDTNTKFALMESYLKTNDNIKSLDDLINRESTKQLNKESFCNCLNTVEGTPTIYSVNASSNTVYNRSKEMKESIENIIEMAKSIVDIVIIDNTAGTSELSSFVNKKADYIINIMKLNRFNLDNLQQTNQLTEIKEDKYINVFNMYREETGIDIGEIAKVWGIQDAHILSYDASLDYQLNSGNIVKYVKEGSSDYLVSAKQLTEKVVEKLGLEIEVEINGKAKKKQKKKGLRQLLGLGG